MPTTKTIIVGEQWQGATDRHRRHRVEVTHRQANAANGHRHQGEHEKENANLRVSYGKAISIWPPKYGRPVDHQRRDERQLKEAYGNGTAHQHTRHNHLGVVAARGGGDGGQVHQARLEAGRDQHQQRGGHLLQQGRGQQHVQCPPACSVGGVHAQRPDGEHNHQGRQGSKRQPAVREP